MLGVNYSIGSVCIALAVCLAATASDPVPTSQPSPAQGEQPRSAKFAPLSGRVVGILVWDIKEVMSTEGRTGPAGAVGFASGKNRYRWVYVQCGQERSDVDEVTLPVGKTAGQTRRFASVCLATAT